jgi:hypothetical protein
MGKLKVSLARLVRLVPVLLTSTAAVFSPAALQTATVVAQEAGSDLARLDVASVSVDELEAAVASDLASLPPGLSDEEQVAAIAERLRPSLVGLSPDQIEAVAANVAAILVALGVDVGTTGELQALLIATIYEDEVFGLNTGGFVFEDGGAVFPTSIY